MVAFMTLDMAIIELDAGSLADPWHYSLYNTFKALSPVLPDAMGSFHIAERAGRYPRIFYPAKF